MTQPLPLPPTRPPSVLVAGAFVTGLLVLGSAGSADADVVTALADLRGAVEQRIAEYEPDPAKRKLVKALREVSAALATSKRTLSKDAKSAGAAILGLERSAPGDGLLAPSVQRLVDEFHLGMAGEQQTLQAFVAALPEGGKRRRAEKTALRASEIFGAYGAAPTQSARMVVLRKSAAAVEKGYRIGGAKKGTFVTATIDGTSFSSFAPTATIGASGDLMAPHAFALAATAGPAARAHRKLEVRVNLQFLGAGGGLLGDQNVARVSFCPGGAGVCTEFATDAQNFGSVGVHRLDAGYGLVAGTFDFMATDGQGNTATVGSGVFRAKYE